MNNDSCSIFGVLRVFNTVLSLVTVGMLTASGADYILSIEHQTQVVSGEYKKAADERFHEYEKILPGSVKYPE